MLLVHAATPRGCISRVRRGSTPGPLLPCPPPRHWPLSFLPPYPTTAKRAAGGILMGPRHHSQVDTHLQMTLCEANDNSPRSPGRKPVTRSRQNWKTDSCSASSLVYGSLQWAGHRHSQMNTQAELSGECSVLGCPAWSLRKRACISGSTRTTQTPLQEHTPNTLKWGKCCI